MAPAHASRCNHLADIAGWTRAIHDRAFAMASEPGVPLFLGGDHAISMGTITGVARARAAQGRETAVLWLDAHADYNTPETTPSGNMHGMALAFAAGDPILAPLLGDRPVHAIAPADITLFGARSIDPEEKARLRAHGVDAVDMRAIDERGVSALLAERIAALAGARRLAPRQLRPRLPRPGGRAGHRHHRPGRRHLPRGAPRHGDALRLAASSARSTSSSSTPSSTSAAAARSSPPNWSRASSAAPCSTASRARSPPPDGDPDARHRRPDRPRDPPRRPQLQAARRRADRRARAPGSPTSRATATSTASPPIPRSTRATATRRSSPRWSSRRSGSR